MSGAALQQQLQNSGKIPDPEPEESETSHLHCLLTVSENSAVLQKTNILPAVCRLQNKKCSIFAHLFHVLLGWKENKTKRAEPKQDWGRDLKGERDFMTSHGA